ncbi:hypothetical protein QVN89_16035, partial [Bacteroides gallinaceum]|nr:hypothetical protein [Bacteroides gallinaceum]
PSDLLFVYLRFTINEFRKSHVGAYRIRPECICVDKLAHSGVSHTPYSSLSEMRKHFFISVI